MIGQLTCVKEGGERLIGKGRKRRKETKMNIVKWGRKGKGAK